ncbi:hypothetical protein HFV02_05375 [Acidithiobacillus caldus]|uniref:DUF7146 domain-containing protein n=1 Tax=Acidithiobacillus caldus TaxID=33059 RepID=UPI001C078714|nr:toprim domain-containing protein [Acidithiobacillus caldus]MBU2801694.1 hypothetical protein [Acidithiobacillus caldus]
MISDFLAGITRLGTHRRPCPECGKGPKDQALSVTLKDDGCFTWFCHRCGFKGAYGARQERPQVQPAKEPVVFTELSTQGRKLWESCRPLAGTVAEQYLTARGCPLPPEDGDLRFYPALEHPITKYRGPALVALVTDIVTRKPLTLHRTWIKADGKKAPEATPSRLLLGRHRKAGGAIRLWPDDAVTMGLTIAEGIETALAAAWASPPVWSLIDAGNLGQFPVLPGIEGLTIVADHDAAGLKAAKACSERWRAAGVDVQVIVPPRPGTDLADIAAGAA